VSLARMRPPYAEASDDDEHGDLAAIPRPVPRAFLRVVVAATVVTLLVGSILLFRSHAKPAHPVAADENTSVPPREPVAPVPSGAAPTPSEAVAPSASAPGGASASAAVRTSPAVDASPASPALPPPLPAVASDSPSAHSLVAQAQALLDRGSYARAAEVARRATQTDPSYAEGWLTLGGAYGAAGSTSQAHAAYRKCVELAKGRGVSECRALLAE
jgi:hypothetical protein